MKAIKVATICVRILVTAICLTYLQYKMITLFILIITLITLYFIVRLNGRTSKWINSTHKNPPMVPGSLPFIGHILKLGESPHVKLTEWAKKHGSIFTVKLGPQKTVVIDDPQLMREAFNDPAFSGRIQNAVFHYTSEGGHGVILSEGESWQTLRRFTLKHLRDFGYGKNYMENLIMGEVNDVLAALSANVGRPFTIHRKFAVAVLNSLWFITSGQRPEQNDSALHTLLLNWITSFNELIPTGLMFAPWMRHIAPSRTGWNSFKESIDRLRQVSNITVEDHFRNHDENNPKDLIDAYITEIKKTKDVSSPFFGEKGCKFTQEYHENLQNLRFNVVGFYLLDTNLRATMMDILQAGSETTSSTLTWAILYLTAHQDVQEKLQAEISKVAGTSRKPSLSDRSRMPYTEALISEVLRKSSFVPLGVMHRASVDKEFHGYLIPKGTVILGNLYSAHYNPKYWGDPENFRPERFLSPDGTTVVNNEALVPFQIGRRRCLGESFAKDSLFLFITSIFQQFKILPDPQNPVLDFEPIPGFVLGPKPFSILIKTKE